jgi:hypothetical protein
MWITHRKTSKKRSAASKPVVDKKEAVVTPPVVVEEEHQPVVTPSYKIVKKNPFIKDEEIDFDFEAEDE